MNKKRYLLSASLSTLALSVATYAQDAASDVQLDEVVITAQKRSEPLQRAPVTVTALSASTLEQRTITGIADLQSSVPGLVIGGNANFGGLNTISLRGINSPILPIGTEDAVGVYLDGVYLPRSDAAFFNFADVERIEVLRGPQGTLYGRNTTGGAINIITRAPPEEFRGSIEGSYGNFGENQLKAYFGGPVSDNVRFSLSGVKSGHDGYFTNANTGNDVGEQDDFTGRGKLEITAGALKATIAGDYSTFKSEDYFQAIRTATGGLFVGVGDPDVIESEFEPGVDTDRESYGGSVTAEYALSDSTTLTSITSYRKFVTHSDVDTDGQGLATPYFYTFSDLGNKQWNQELRLNYGSEKVNLIAGANYFQDTSFLDYETQSNGGPNFFNNEAKTSAWAAFAQFDYAVTDATKLIMGLRYNRDHKDFSVLYPAFVHPTLGALAETFRTDDRTDDAYLPKIGLSHQLNADIFLFATVSKGYRAGAYNPAPGRGQPAGPGANPEKLTNYELGAKSQLFDNRVRLNTTLFYEDFKDLQVRQTIAPATTVINNAGSATLYGAEIETSILLGGGFGIDSSLSLLNTEYDSLFEQVSATSILDRSGNQLIRAPELQFSVNVHYDGDIGNQRRFKANLSWFKESKSYYSAENNPWVGNDGWDSLDARVGVAHPSGWEVYAYGKNLTGERYVTHVITLLAYPATVNPDTRYGVGVKYEF